jgi:hypothetical protein
MLVFSIARSVNNWPSVLYALPTAVPLQLTVIGAIGVGLVGLMLSASLVGLVLGWVPKQMVGAGSLSDGEARRLGVAVGLFGAAVSAIAGWLRTPDWARAPHLDAAGSVLPVLQTAIDPISRVLMGSAVLLAAVLVVDQWTRGWTRRRAAGALTLALVGFAAGGPPPGVAAGGWMLAGLVLGAALVLLYVTILRFDFTVVPLALATMIAFSTAARGVERGYPGAVPGSIAGAILVVLVGWWCFTALRRARRRATDSPEQSPESRLTAGEVAETKGVS